MRALMPIPWRIVSNVACTFCNKCRVSLRYGVQSMTTNTVCSDRKKGNRRWSLRAVVCVHFRCEAWRLFVCILCWLKAGRWVPESAFHIRNLSSSPKVLPARYSSVPTLTPATTHADPPSPPPCSQSPAKRPPRRRIPMDDFVINTQPAAE